MIKRIIVEGADQQGKTTLCNLLKEKLGYDVVHYGKPADDFDFHVDYFLQDNTISDRNFLSEIVYSRINNRESRIKGPEKLEQDFIDSETVLILMDRGPHFEFDNTRHEDYSQYDIAKAIGIYREEFKKLKLRKFQLNTNCNCFESNVDMLLQLIGLDYASL